MKNNWLRMKKQFLAYMSREKLTQLEYRDDAKYSLLNPTCKQIKEVPFIQNNPEKQQTITATAISQDNAAERQLKERKDKIEMLKRSLMQPVSRAEVRRQSVVVSLTQNNMSSEVAEFRRKQLTQYDTTQKAPAKLDPNNSMRRLSITA